MKKSIKFKGRLRNYMYGPMLLAVLLVLMNIPMYFYQKEAGLAISVFTVVYCIVVTVSFHRSKPYFMNELINFATQYGTVQKKLLNEFDVAYALIDYNGKILWVNEKFTELTGKDKDYHRSITSVFSHITREIIQKNKTESQLHIGWDGREFRAQLKRIEFSSITPENQMVSIEGSDEYMTALYLYDETQLNRYIRENDDQKLVAALIYIDNYEEALNSIEDVKQSLLVALIDRKVNKYFSGMDGLVRKVEKDKYFVVFRYIYLAKMEEDKFSLLDEVKTVKVGNEMAVTLSIGIGSTGDTYNQSYEYARMAIGMALGQIGRASCRERV